MKIGVDARCLSRKLTGIGFYCLNIIKNLTVHEEIEIILFTSRTLQVDIKHLSNVSVVESGFKGSVICQVWSETYLPFLIKKYKIDVFWGPSHRIPFFLSKKIPAVLTIHDLVWKKAPETMAKPTRLLETIFMPPSLRIADAVIVDSLSTANDLEEYYPNFKNKIKHIPLGPSETNNINVQKPNIISSKSNRIVFPDNNYILFVGTLEPRKNLPRLIEAFSILPERLKQKFQLIIAGRAGWGDVEIDSLSNTFNVKNRVKALGYVSGEELKQLYKSAYVLAMPSLYEGFGLPILEAQSCGVPVITSNISSMPEVAGDGAILVEPKSVLNISKGLEQILSNSKLRSELSKKALRNSEKFSWESTAAKTLDVFTRAIKK